MAKKQVSQTSRLSDAQIEQVRLRQGEHGIAIDDHIAHSRIAPNPALTIDQARTHDAWVQDPADADIIGVDTIKPDIRGKERKERGEKPPPLDPKDPKKPAKKRPKAVDHPGGGPDAGPAFKGYEIVGGSPAERAHLDKTIKSNFTKGELEDTRGLVIEIGSGKLARSGAAGFYLDAAAAALRAGRGSVISKKAAAVPGIRHYLKIGKPYVQGDVITHEITHHIRAQRLRKGGAPEGDITTRQARDLYLDRDREEATTDLETIARHNKFENPATKVIERPSPAGYYQRLVPRRAAGSGEPNWGDRISALELQDRAVITLDGKENVKLGLAAAKSETLRTSGKQGVELRKRINRSFQKTNMGRSKMGRTASGITGKTENLDQYFASIDDAGNVIARAHIRSHKMISQDKTVISALRQVSQGAGKIVKFNDGKATTIARFGGGRKATFT